MQFDACKLYIIQQCVCITIQKKNQLLSVSGVLNQMLFVLSHTVYVCKASYSNIVLFEAMSSTIAGVFQRGTFLGSRVTYGGANSGAI